MCPAWRKHSGNNSSVRAVKMQRMEEGRHQGVTGNLFCYCCSIHWSWGHFSMKWQSDKAFQRGKAGSTRYWASEKSCAQLFWSGCHGQGEGKAQGGSAVLPIPKCLAWASLFWPCHALATWHNLCWMGDPATGFPHAGKAEGFLLFIVPVISGSNTCWYSRCPLMQWSCSPFALRWMNPTSHSFWRDLSPEELSLLAEARAEAHLLSQEWQYLYTLSPV